MIPAPGTSIVLLGGEKFGWLKRLLQRAMKSKWNRSVIGKRFRMDKLLLMMPGPSRTLMPESPYLPMLAGLEHAGSESGQPGILKALVSNQRSIVRWPGGKFPLAIRSGSPPNELVFEGSVVEKKGENHWPVW